MDWLNKIFKKKEAVKGPKGIFLDYASATPLLPEVRKEMEPFWTENFYNPNAIYEEGEKVKKIVEGYREKIARLLGVTPRSVIFTSGGTEANVLAVRGVKPGRVVVEPEAHPSVAEAVLESDVKEITLVSSVTTDNKLGRQIREERKKKGSDYPLLHIDASQTVGYFNVGLEILACDLLTLDSAKIYGPKGIGALVVRNSRNIAIPPRGTPPVPLIAGFAKALEIAVRDREQEKQRLLLLSTYFVDEVKKNLPQADVSVVSPNVINISLPGVLPEFLVLKLDSCGLKVSAGPACESNQPEPANSPVRISLGRFTTEKELNEAIKIFCREAQNMLKSPHVSTI